MYSVTEKQAEELKELLPPPPLLEVGEIFLHKRRKVYG